MRTFLVTTLFLFGAGVVLSRTEPAEARTPCEKALKNSKKVCKRKIHRSRVYSNRIRYHMESYHYYPAEEFDQSGNRYYCVKKKQEKK